MMPNMTIETEAALSRVPMFSIFLIIGFSVGVYDALFRSALR